MVWINMWRRNGSMESSVLGGTAGRLLRDYCQSTAWRLVLLMAPSWSERARHLLATTHCHFGLFLVICIPFTYFQNQIYIRSKFSSSLQLHVIAYVSNKSSFSFRLLECFFFFVRKLDSLTNMLFFFSINLWKRRSGRVQHCRIHSRQEAGSPKFYLTDNLVFDTLFALINHYQQVALRCNEFEMKLTEPVPQTNAHESKE